MLHHLTTACIMNVNDHRNVLALREPQQERPEKFRPEWGFEP